MIRKLTINDFDIVESIISKLHKMHVESRPDFYIENERPITWNESTKNSIRNEVRIMKEIIEYYNNYDEEGRLKKKNRSPEYITTMRYIEKYLKPNSKILEIGAGTGRYSVTLADMGYDVTAVELVEHNIEIMKKKVKPEHNIKIYQGNACDLSFIDSDTYDIVLLLGPMYHLFNDEDKNKAISEAIRVAKKGGIIYSAYCNSDTCIYKMFYKKKILHYIISRQWIDRRELSYCFNSG